MESMRGLVLFCVETQTGGIDQRLLDALNQDQSNHAAMYQIQEVRVRIHANQDRVSEDGKQWSVRTNGLGDLSDPKKDLEQARILSTSLFGMIHAQGNIDCNLALLSNGEPATATAAVQIAYLMEKELSKLCPTRIHLFLLQNQYVHNDPGTGRLMDWIRKSNGIQPKFFSSLYLFPWDNDEDTRDSTRMTITALVKATMMSEHDPMTVPSEGRSMWFETAVLHRLEAPVERVTNVVFRYISGKYRTEVLEKLLTREGQASLPPKEVRNCIQNLLGFMVKMEKDSQLALPDFEELLYIMPVCDPDPASGDDKDLSDGRAWDILYRIYGREQGERLNARLNPGLQTLKEQYDQMRRSLTMELLRSVIQLAEGADSAFLPFQLLSQIGEALTKKLREERTAMPGEMEYDHSLFRSEKKDAIAKARIRHHALRVAYCAAAKRMAEERKRLRDEMTRSAVSGAKQFLNDCLNCLNMLYEKRCAIYLDRQVEKHCYEDGLEDAYEHWCASSSAIRPIVARDMYDLFTEDVLRMNAETAAQTLCDELETLTMQRVQSAMETIRIRVSKFFSELELRSAQLERMGHKFNSSESLLAYLNKSAAMSPILYSPAAGDPIQIRARALVFYVSDLDNAVSFSNRARENDIAVINDVHETGVSMIVKYAGNGLENVLVYKNNVQ